MLNGVYIYEQTDYYGKILGHIKIKVTETEKTYLFILLGNTTRYDYDQFILLFKNSNKTRINKTYHGNINHAMRVWSDNDFTIYPFQAGIPFWFKREKEYIL